jgi:hypothetical protein
MLVSRQNIFVTEQIAFKPVSELIAYIGVVFQHKNIQNKLITQT